MTDEAARLAAQRAACIEGAKAEYEALAKRYTAAHGIDPAHVRAVGSLAAAAPFDEKYKPRLQRRTAMCEQLYREPLVVEVSSGYRYRIVDGQLQYSFPDSAWFTSRQPLDDIRKLASLLP